MRKIIILIIFKINTFKDLYVFVLVKNKKNFFDNDFKNAIDANIYFSQFK